MTKRLTALAFVVAVLILTVNANAQTRSTKEGWELDLKKISLNLTTTQVENSKTYGDFPNSRLNADTQTLIQGYFDFAADYHAPLYKWGNELLMQYGRTTVKPYEGEETKTENVDQLLFTTDLSLRIWHINKIGGFDMGPFISASYETEFTKQSGTKRKQVLRERLGAKAFEGIYIKNFYVAAVLEEDFTYSPTSYNTAWEAGAKVEHPIRDGVKAVYSATFRDYFDHSEKQPTDLDYELELDARMDVLVLKNLSIAPFINYYIAQGKYTPGLGQNLYVGVSFSFSRLFKAAREVAS